MTNAEKKILIITVTVPKEKVNRQRKLIRYRWYLQYILNSLIVVLIRKCIGLITVWQDLITVLKYTAAAKGILSIKIITNYYVLFRLLRTVFLRDHNICYLQFSRGFRTTGEKKPHWLTLFCAGTGHQSNMLLQLMLLNPISDG